MAPRLMDRSEFLGMVDGIQNKRLNALENGRHTEYMQYTKDYENLRQRNSRIFDEVETDLRTTQEAGLPVSGAYSQFSEAQFQRRVAIRGLTTDPYQSPRFKEYWMARRGAGQEAAEVLAAGTRNPEDLVGEKKDQYDVYTAALSENIAPTESLGQFYKTAKGALTGRAVQVDTARTDEQRLEFKSQDEAATRSATLALYRGFNGDVQQAQQFLGALGSYVPRSSTSSTLDQVVDLGYSVQAATKAVGPQAFYGALNSLSASDKQKVINEAGGDPAELVRLAKELAEVPAATGFGPMAALSSVPGATNTNIADPKALVELRRAEIRARRGLGDVNTAEMTKNAQKVRDAIALEQVGYPYMQEGKLKEALSYILPARLDIYNAQNAITQKKDIYGTIMDGASAYAGDGISRDTVLTMRKHLEADRDAKSGPRVDYSSYFELADDLGTTADRLSSATTPIDVITPAAEQAGYATATDFVEQVFPGATGDLIASANTLQSRGRVLKAAMKKAPLLQSDVEANQSTIDDAIRNVGTLVLSGAPTGQDALVQAPRPEPKPGSVIRQMTAPMWPQLSQVVSEEARAAQARPPNRAGLVSNSTAGISSAEAWTAGAKALEQTFGSLEAAFYKDDQGVIRMQDRRARGGTVQIAGRAVPVAPTSREDKALLGAYALGLSDEGLRALARQQADRAEQASKVAESRKWLKDNDEVVRQMGIKLGIASRKELQSMPPVQRAAVGQVRQQTANSLNAANSAMGQSAPASVAPVKR